MYILRCDIIVEVNKRRMEVIFLENDNNISSCMLPSFSREEKAEKIKRKIVQFLSGSFDFVV